MPKRLSENQKQEIISSFTNGSTIEELSEKFIFAKSTIIRNLKNSLTEEKYYSLLKNNKEKSSNLISYEKQNKTNINNQYKNIDPHENLPDARNKFEINNTSDFYSENTFMEITPLDCEIKSESQKDLSSVSISQIDFPKVVYMIVDNKIELEIKFLRDFPDWQFLSQNDLNRKTIEIYFDLKTAKKFCTRDQKVIKVPNTDVFKIVAPILVSRGISRIVCPDKLISL